MRIYVLFLCISLLVGCSSRTRIIYNENFDLESHSAFNVRGLRIEPSFGSSTVVPQQGQELLGELNKLISAKGYKENISAPDFLVTVRVTATEHTNLLGGDVAYMKGADSSFSSTKPRARSYQSDSLVLEISKGLNKPPAIVGLCNIRPEYAPLVRDLPVNNPKLRMTELSECAEEIISKLPNAAPKAPSK